MQPYSLLVPPNGDLHVNFIESQSVLERTKMGRASSGPGRQGTCAYTYTGTNTDSERQRGRIETQKYRQTYNGHIDRVTDRQIDRLIQKDHAAYHLTASNLEDVPEGYVDDIVHHHRSEDTDLLHGDEYEELAWGLNRKSNSNPFARVHREPDYIEGIHTLNKEQACKNMHTYIQRASERSREKR